MQWYTLLYMAAAGTGCYTLLYAVMHCYSCFLQCAAALRYTPLCVAIRRYTLRVAVGQLYASMRSYTLLYTVKPCYTLLYLEKKQF